MINYINEIAQIKKKERFNAIIKVLNDNNIQYRIQELPSSEALGNIIIEYNSTKGKKIVVSAHYDNVHNTPGANDNASACSILLNLILSLKNTDKNIEFVFFDLEESSFVGSNYYLEKEYRNILYAFNLDMCGLGENIVCSISNINSSIIDKLFDDYNCIKVNKLPPGDAYVFLRYSIPLFYVVNSTNNDIEWYKAYANNIINRKSDFMKTMHDPSDTVDTINLNQVEKIYKFVLEIINNY